MAEVKRMCNETRTAKTPSNRGKHAKILISFEAMGDDRAANGSIVRPVSGPKDRLRCSATYFPVDRLCHLSIASLTDEVGGMLLPRSIDNP